jgi:hypothetical protein
MNNCFRKFEWPNFDSIQERLVPLIIELFEKRKKENLNFFNKFTNEEFEQINKVVPEFVPSIENNLRSKINWIRMLYLDENFPKNCAHCDVGEEVCADGLLDSFYRLNWPILNPDSFETVFFDSNGRQPVWSEQWQRLVYNEDELKRVCSLIADKPVLMNVRKIHGIYRVRPESPRILLSVRLINGSNQFLKDLATGIEDIG